jgi:hypothetical protein
VSTPDFDPLDPLEERLRGALHRAAASVSPSTDGLSGIRAAIDRDGARPSMRRYWMPAVAAAAVLALAVLTPALLQVGPWEPSQVARNLATPSPVAPLPVYYVAQQDGRWALVREFAPTTLTDPQERLASAIRMAVAGRPTDRDYTSVWRHEHVTSALPADLAGQVTATSTPALTTVTLQGEGLLGNDTGMAATQPELIRLAVQQLVWTATAVTQSTTPVRLASSSPDPLLFGAVPLNQEFGRTTGGGDPRAPIWINTLIDGQRLQVGTATVEGDAVASAAGPVGWTLYLLDGDRQTSVVSGRAELVTDRATTPELGQRGTWRVVRLPLTEPGTYLLQVVQDGWRDTKQLEVVR